MDAGRPGEAIDALKTLDGLGLASWGDLGTLATALNAENRDNEIGSLVARAMREPTPTEMSESVILRGQTEYVGDARYRQALRFVTDPKTHGFQGARLYIAGMRGRLRADEAEIARGLAPYLPTVPAQSAEGRYLAAHVALGEGRDAEAIALAEGAGALPDGLRLKADLRRVRFEAAQRLKDEAKIDAVIAEGEMDAKDPFPWATERLRRLRDSKDEGFAAAAQAYAATIDSDRRMSELIVLLGSDAGELREDAERLTKLHPYSWQAHVNSWLVMSAALGLEDVPDLPEEAFKYAPDRADLVRQALNRFDDALEQARVEGRVSGRAAMRARDQLVSRYASHWDVVKESPVAVMGMARMLMRSAQPVRGAAFARSFLWPYAKQQTYVRRQLMATCLFLALNGADEALATEVFRTLEKEGALAPRSIVRYVLHQALVGNEKEAERAIALRPKLGRGEPDPLVRSHFAAARALLAAKRGDQTGLDKWMAEVKTPDRTVEMTGYFALFSGPKGVFSQKLADFVLEPNGEFADLQIAATVAGLRRYKDATDENGIGLRDGLSKLAAEYPGHPWTVAIGHSALEGQNHWVGTTYFEGLYIDGVVAESFEMQIRVDAKGNAKGVGKITEPDRPMTLSGKVDARGNLSGELLDASGKAMYRLEMKLTPTDLLIKQLAEAMMAEVYLDPIRGNLTRDVAAGGTMLMQATRVSASPDFGIVPLAVSARRAPALTASATLPAAGTGEQHGSH